MIVTFKYLISLVKWQLKVIGPQAHMGLLCGCNTPCQYDLELIQSADDILPYHLPTPLGSFTVYYSSKLLSNRWPSFRVSLQFFLNCSWSESAQSQAILLINGASWQDNCYLRWEGFSSLTYSLWPTYFLLIKVLVGLQVLDSFGCIFTSGSFTCLAA